MHKGVDSTSLYFQNLTTIALWIRFIWATGPAMRGLELWVEMGRGKRIPHSNTEPAPMHAISTLVPQTYPLGEGRPHVREEPRWSCSEISSTTLANEGSSVIALSIFE